MWFELHLNDPNGFVYEAATMVPGPRPSASCTNITSLSLPTTLPRARCYPRLKDEAITTQRLTGWWPHRNGSIKKKISVRPSPKWRSNSAAPKAYCLWWEPGRPEMSNKLPSPSSLSPMCTLSPCLCFSCGSCLLPQDLAVPDPGLLC